MSTPSSPPDSEMVTATLTAVALLFLGIPTFFLLAFVTERHIAGYDTFGATGADVVAGIVVSQVVVVGLAIATAVVAGCQGVRHRAVCTLAITTVATTVGLALIPAVFGTTHAAAGTGLVLVSLTPPVAITVIATVMMCTWRTGTWDTLRHSITQ